MKIKLNPIKFWLIASGIALFALSCNKNPDQSPVIEKDIQVENFNKIYAGERFNLIITRGNSFSVKVKGPRDTVNDIEWNVANSVLDIQYAHYIANRPKVDVYITLPTLIQLNLSGAASSTIDGFHDVNHVIRTVLSGAARCVLNGTGINTQIDISGASELIANGTTGSLYGTISGAGKLSAFELVADEVDIVASGGSQARVRVVNSFFADASGGSTIYYIGTPGIKNIQTSGGGRVLQQQ